MDAETLRVDLQRTRDRLERARENGDRAAVMIGESRLRRVTAELTAALGLQSPSMSGVTTTEPRS